jgi:catechol 2,3-dioxygenase-like lactoylglutathione lyase family enzyme
MAQTHTQTSAPITGMLTVGVPVVDQDRARAFYAETLGFETRLDVPAGNGSRWIELAPPGGGVSIALERAREGHPAGVETGIRFTTADADVAHAVLRSRGVDADDVLRWPGVPPMFAFRDQDGNGLEIVEA